MTAFTKTVEATTPTTSLLGRASTLYKTISTSSAGTGSITRLGQFIRAWRITSVSVAAIAKVKVFGRTIAATAVSVGIILTTGIAGFLKKTIGFLFKIIPSTQSKIPPFNASDKDKISRSR